MKNDRFFLFILMGICIIVIVSIIFVVTNQNKITYLPDDTPEGVANNYLLSWVNKDYESIEKYLANGEYKPDIDIIIDTVNENKYSLDDVGASIDSSNIYDDKATVIITILHTGNGYDGYRYDSGDAISLIKQNRQWKIKDAPYPFWGWDWYQSPDEPNKY